MIMRYQILVEFTYSCSFKSYRYVFSNIYVQHLQILYFNRQLLNKTVRIISITIYNLLAFAQV